MYDKVMNFFIEVSSILYPGEYSKEQLTNIFKDNVNVVLKSNTTKYTDFNKTFAVNQLYEFDSSLMNEFNKILINAETPSISNDDKNYYIDKFTSEFIKLFPDLYTKEELKTIIADNVKIIVIDYLKDNRYIPTEKKIQLNHDEFDSITFHEFIHSLRGELYTCFHGIDEGLTELCAMMYKAQSTDLNLVKYDDSTYGKLVSYSIRLCNLRKKLLSNYLNRKDFGYLFNNKELINVIYLMEDLYNLDSYNFSMITKEEKSNIINEAIDKSLSRTN